MTTAGLAGYDGCHFDYGGYSQMGRRLLGILTRDLYGSQDTLGVRPPNARLAWFNPDRDEVRILYDSPVTWPADTLGARMRDYFYVYGHGQDARIVSGQVLEDGRTVLLSLLVPMSLADRLAYLPNCCYPNDAPYLGPWIRNTRGLAAYSLWDFPIQEAAQVAQPEANELLASVTCHPSVCTRSTRICFTQYLPGPVRLHVAGLDGRSVRTLMDQSADAGNHVVWWNGTDDCGRRLSAGIYVLLLEGRGHRSQRRFTLIH